MKSLYLNWTIGGPGYAVLQDKLIVENRRFNKDSVIEEPSTYEWIDLGLPSGLLWASTNIGAEKPEDFGLYFAWGEILGYEDVTIDKQFTWEDYKFGTEDTLTKYNTDGLTTLELEDDAAYVSDNTCRMPTKTDFEELAVNTTNTWETLNGVNGRRFTSNINGNSIFVPAAGACYRGSVNDVGSFGWYWSSSLNEIDPNGSWCLASISEFMDVTVDIRSSGYSIRPVKSIN